MLTEDVDPDDGSLPLGVRTLDDIVVEVLLPSHLVESLKDEFEQRLQVLGTGGGDEDVGVGVEDGEGDGQSERGGLSSSPCCSERDGLGERLGGDGIGEGEDRLGLVERPRLGDDFSHTLRVLQSLLQLPQLCLTLDFLPLALARRSAKSDASTFLERHDVLAGGEREDVEFVVDDEARWVCAEGEKESLVKSCNGCRQRRGSAVPRMNVLRPTSSALVPRILIIRLTMVIEYSPLRLFIPCNKHTTIPPPSTVSIVLANKLGVMASKSWRTSILNVCPKILCVSL